MTMYLSTKDREKNRNILEDKKRKYQEYFNPDRLGALANNRDYLREELDNWLQLTSNLNDYSARRIILLLFEYFYSIGDFDTINKKWSDMLLISEGISKQEAGLIYSQLATIKTDQGDFDVAEKYFCKSLKLFQDSCDPRAEASSLYQLGNLYLRMNNESEAKNYLEGCISLTQRIGFKRLELHARGQYAKLIARQGRISEAIELLKQDVDQWNIIPDDHDRGFLHTTLHTLGRLFLAQGRYTESYSTLKESLYQKQKTSIGNYRISQTTCLLAEACVNLNKIDESEEYINRIYQILQDSRDYNYLANAQKILGIIFYKRGKFRDSKQHFINAFHFAQHPIYAETKLEIASWLTRVSIRLLDTKTLYLGLSMIFRQSRLIGLSNILRGMLTRIRV